MSDHTPTHETTTHETTQRILDKALQDVTAPSPSVTSIQGHTKAEWQKVKRIISPALHLPPGSALTRAAIDLLRQAVQDNPDEWAYWYALGDYYQRLDRDLLSLSPCLNCYRLRPQDPRSAYALATAYRSCAREYGRNGLDPDEDSALIAFTLFFQVLDAPIPTRQQRFVSRHLISMMKEYPDLASHIPDRYCPQTTQTHGCRNLAIFAAVLLGLALSVIGYFFLMFHL